jgi:FKBP-type peptidyl-prolyl cis-trans isomerase 2
VARKEFPVGAALAPGSRFEAGVGPGQTVLLEVARVDDAEVHVRMIHPLAGQRIGMSVKILGVRDATSAERESGRAATRPPPPPR